MSQSANDEKFAAIYDSLEGKNQDALLLDAFFGFCRRRTQLLGGGVKKVVKIAQRHVDFVQKQEAKRKAAAAAAAKKVSSSTPTSSSSSSAAAVSPVTPLNAEGGNNVTVEEVDSEDENVTVLPEDTAAPRGKAPLGNGGKVEGRYVWTQTLGELTLNVQCPGATKGRDCKVTIEPGFLSISVPGVNGGAAVVDGQLLEKIQVDDSTWTLDTNDDGSNTKVLSVYLPKQDKMQWWKAVVEGDPEINTADIVPENSKLHDLDPSTRSTVEKMMQDQRNKQMGLPSVDEENKQNALKRFMEQHPEME
jgi:hypothetical protein